MHPELRRFIDSFEREAREEGRLRHTLGHAETRFLERVWGPFMNFNFEGLKPEYPFFDFEGGQRFVDFYYSRGPVKLIIEIDGYTTHAQVSKIEIPRSSPQTESIDVHGLVPIAIYRE